LSLRLKAVFSPMLFVEQIEHSHGTIGLDQIESAPLDFFGQSTALIGQLLIAGDKNGLIALGFDQLVHVEVAAFDRGALNAAQLRLLLIQFGTTFGQDLLRAKCIGERGPLLVAVDNPQSAKRVESELVFGHGSS